jgi:hypothetical protein
VLGAAQSGGDAPAVSVVDQALAVLLRRFGELDADGDGELSGEELLDGACGSDAELRQACNALLDQPLVLANVALVGVGFAWHEGSDDIEVEHVRLTLDDLAAAIAQNRVVRTLADPRRFAALDRATTGTIDGRVSAEDVRAFLEHEDDPDVRAALEHLLDEDLLDRIDREGALGGSDGRIAYDQVYALGVHQGALLGLADPTIPAGLPSAGSPPVDDGDMTPQFIHQEVPRQPGVGQVVIAMYIPTETAGIPGPNVGKSHGDDRGADPLAHPSRSRVWIVIDYEEGVATARINPSCGTGGPPDDCHGPLPIVSDNGTVATWWSRVPLLVDDSNRARFLDGDEGSTIVQLTVLNSDKRLVAPAINAEFEVTMLDDDRVELTWSRDSYPALEAYHVYPDGTIVGIADEGAAWMPAPGLLPGPVTHEHGAGVG